MLKFYHAPWSRSSSILWLLEEVGTEYELVPIDIRAEGGVPETYRRIQPNKKVPAIEHGGVVITERPAISIYLADTFKEAGLAPAIDHADRGAWLTMLVWCSAVFDPCITARVRGMEYESNDFAFGLFDDMVDYLERVVSERQFAAGDRFSAADVQVASSIDYTMNLVKALPPRPAFSAYLERVGQRPALVRSQEIDRDLARSVLLFASEFSQDT